MESYIRVSPPQHWQNSQPLPTCRRFPDSCQADVISWYSRAKWLLWSWSDAECLLQDIKHVS